MIAGLPLGTWVLMAAAVVPGLALVVAAWRIHRSRDAEAPGSGAEGADSAAGADR